MRVLLSAYACEPGKGSESGVGWNWAIELAALGHRVSVLTRSNNRPTIEYALAEMVANGSPATGIEFHYYDLPSWIRRWKRGNRLIEVFYLLWQIGAFAHARKLCRTTRFDLVHHLTFGGFRQPSLMGFLGLPFVVGPLGGGECTPEQLKDSFPPAQARVESLRELANWLVDLDPLVRAMYRRATVIFCKTEQTRDRLPACFRSKVQTQLEIGLHPASVLDEPAAPTCSTEFLYAGRLLYWKGVQLALKALVELRKTCPAATLTLIGTGKDEASLRQLSVHLGLADAVYWRGPVSHAELISAYGSYTAFVFPSLHDSSGNVILEALSQALPVICLDTGGPGALLPADCGFKVPVLNRSQQQVVADLAAAMQQLAANPSQRSQMAHNAMAAARRMTWKGIVSQAYQRIEQALAATPCAESNF